MNRHMMITMLLLLAMLLSACSVELRTDARPIDTSSATTAAREPFTGVYSDPPVPHGERDQVYYEMKDVWCDLHYYKTKQYELEDVIGDYEVCAVRDTLPNPYVKVRFPNGFVGFLFYREEGGKKYLTDIWQTDRFMTQEYADTFAAGKTTVRELFDHDFYFIGAPISSESITAHYLPRGIYVIRGDWTGDETVGIATSVEFFPNETLKEEPLCIFGMTIPYILPEDRNIGQSISSINCGDASPNDP